MKLNYNTPMLIGAAIVLLGIVVGLVLNNATGDLVRLATLVAGAGLLLYGMMQRRRASGGR
jgi:peptidoglycan biosynthesis protein MviN/MurJ (putative lipid II flippase)